MHATSSGHSRHSGPGFCIRRRTMTAASVTAILSTVLALSPTNSSASPKGSGSRAIKPTAIVSLGDSFISGEGGRWQGNVDMPYSATDSMFGTDRATVCGSSGCRKDPEHVYVGNSYWDPTTGKENGCHRSDVAEINESRIPVDRKFNLACSGAVTDHLLPAAAGGRRFKGEAPQADQLKALANTHDIKLVQVSISGNDLGFGDIIESCIRGFIHGPFGQYCWKKFDWEVKEKLRREVPAKVKNVIDQIRKVMRDTGHPDSSYVLALQSYPSPVPLSAAYRYSQGVSVSSQRYSPGGCPFYDQDSNWARLDLVPGIADMLEGVAAEKNVHYLDLQWSFDRHEVCSKWVRQARSGDTLSSPIPTRDAEWMRYLSHGAAHSQGQVEESFHPNSYGQKVLGKCLRDFYDLTRSSGRREYTCLPSQGQGAEGMRLKPLSRS
ncbi:GDSL-type esterase/lipase family protein [Streptomyces platensis]|uniref:GDSL-type esterase/lipase family protein n=1 Tax=Streptomyces platensis TaxID=58346 RepID=UPI00386CD1C2|nr:GDSL-type esterase/lipase family protein [Streptomyces platensis]